MKKSVSLLLVFLLLLAIPCTAMAYQPSRADVTKMRVNSMWSTCLIAERHSDAPVKYSTYRQIVTVKFGEVQTSKVMISQDAGFVSYALKRAGIITGVKTYSELRALTSPIPNPRNGALVFNGSIVGLYFDGNVYYSTFQRFICIKYQAKTWSVGWIKGL